MGRLKLLREEFGSLPLTSITARHVDAYLARRRDQDGITAASANRYLSALKTMMKMAVQWGYLAFHPLERIKTLKEEHKIPEGLHDDELESLLQHLPDYAWRLAVWAADTGMRKSEMERMTWDDIDWRNRSVKVKETKNHSERIIPLTERVYGLATAMRQEMAESEEKRLSVLPVKEIRKSLITAAKKADLGHVHFHMLRHSFATRLLDKGVPIQQVQYLMGHKTIVMTQRYDHARPERYRDAIAALEQ